MSDPIAAAESWLASVLEPDAQLAAAAPGGIHEGEAFEVDASPFVIVTWGTATPFRVFGDEAMWTVYVRLSVQASDGRPASACTPAVDRIHELLTTQPVTGTHRGCMRTLVRRSLFPSPVTGKRETVSEYKLLLHC